MTTASKLALSLTIPDEDRKAAQERHRQIVGLKAELNRNAFALGLALAEMRDQQLYRALGYPSFKDYLLSPEVIVSQRTAYTFIAIARKFERVQHAAHGVDWTKLGILAQLIEFGDSEEEVTALVEQVREMPRPVLQAAIGPAKQTRMATGTLPTHLPAPVPTSLPVPPAASSLTDDEAGGTVIGAEYIEATYTAVPHPFAGLPGLVEEANRALDTFAAGRLPLPPSRLHVVPPPSPQEREPRSRTTGDAGVRRAAMRLDWANLMAALHDVVSRHEPGEIRANRTETEIVNDKAAIARARVWLDAWDEDARPGPRAANGR